MSAATSPSFTLNRLIAEIIFIDPADMNRTVVELIDRDFDVEVLDWIDDEGPAVWILASTLTELDASGFFDRVKTIVEPLGGDVLEAGGTMASCRKARKSSVGPIVHVRPS